MIRNILFDLDGVLFDGAEFHKQIFLEAVENAVSSEYHDRWLNGLSTKQKLARLSELGVFASYQLPTLEAKKQALTQERLATFQSPQHIRAVCQRLAASNYQLFCVSNSIRKTVETCLESLGIIQLFSGIISNEDAAKQKPSPEPYLEAFRRFQLDPAESLILEDSPFGRQAAKASGAHLLPIVDVQDNTYEKIIQHIKTMESSEAAASPRRINVVIPMAGRGSRFAVKGYSTPKPFIPVFDRPMIRWVIDNMKSADPAIQLHFILVAQQEHISHHGLGDICRDAGIDFTLIPIDRITDGPACTVLLARDIINSDAPLVTVNSDQYVEWDVAEFYRALLNPTYAGVINTFHQPDETDTKWSFARVGADGIVEEVVEKRWISPHATTGIYGWRSGAEFVAAADAMMSADDRVNGEFYVAPAYNYVRPVRIFPCKKLWGLGVPEDLEVFLGRFMHEGCAPALN